MREPRRAVGVRRGGERAIRMGRIKVPPCARRARRGCSQCGNSSSARPTLAASGGAPPRRGRCQKKHCKSCSCCARPTAAAARSVLNRRGRRQRGPCNSCCARPAAAAARNGACAGPSGQETEGGVAGVVPQQRRGVGRRVLHRRPQERHERPVAQRALILHSGVRTHVGARVKLRRCRWPRPNLIDRSRDTPSVMSDFGTATGGRFVPPDGMLLIQVTNVGTPETREIDDEHIVTAARAGEHSSRCGSVQACGTGVE